MTRQGTWLLLIALTWYLAGMFRTLPLTVLLLSELALLVLMAIVSAYFHAALDADFPSETAFGEKDSDCRCQIALRMRGRLPIGRPRVTLALSYPGQRRKSVQRFYGGAAPNRTTDLEFYVRPPYCGPVSVELRQVLTWDYLFLYPAKRRKDEHMTLYVLPPPRPLRIRARSTLGSSQGRTQDAPSPQSGMSPEVRDIREYRPGDSARAIHWKLSARTDTLWSREYERETEERLTLLLDLSEPQNKRPRPEDRDAFYEVLSAILLGLAKLGHGARVFWRDGQQDLHWDVGDETSRQAFFARLYDSEPPVGTPEAVLTDFALNTRLQWRRGDALLWQFRADNVLQEIAEQTFVV